MSATTITSIYGTDIKLSPAFEQGCICMELAKDGKPIDNAIFCSDDLVNALREFAGNSEPEADPALAKLTAIEALLGDIAGYLKPVEVTSVINFAGDIVENFPSQLKAVEPEGDPVHDVKHYQRDGLECIDFAAKLDFARGNAFKYVWRCLDKGKTLEDLEKAQRYLDIAEEKGSTLPDGLGEDFYLLYNRWWAAPNGTTMERAEEKRYYILAHMMDGDWSLDELRHEIGDLVSIVRQMEVEA